MGVVLVSDLIESPESPNSQLNPISIQPTEKRIYQGLIQPKNFPPLPEDWTSDWETFPSADGSMQLYSVIHRKKEWKAPRVLMIFHGLGEHGGRYLHFPYFLKSEIDAVYCMDHRGHGRSEGLRGHVDRFEAYIDDAALAVQRLDETLRKRFGLSDIHVLGHSMGGLITLRTLLKYPSLPISSVSISAPLLGIRSAVPIGKKLAAMALSKVWGSVHMLSEVDPEKLSHDKDVVEAYIADRLVHKKVTPRFYTELTAAMANTLRHNSGFEHPLQMLIPLQDEIVNPDVALQFFRSFKLRDKLLKTYPGFFHEPLNEAGKDQVFQDLLLWIKNHFKS
jgi:lysophospholipase